MVDTAPKTGADLFAETLEAYGVQHLFGNPGTTEMPIVDAVSRCDVEYVLALHEDIAVGMASGYASLRRYHADRNPDVNPVGVVNLHLVAGLAHGIANIHGSKFSGTPLVVTAGNHSTDHQYQEPVLSGNQIQMLQQHTKWSKEIKHVDAMPEMLRRAFSVALTPPTGPVFLGLPLNVLTSETEAEPESLRTTTVAGGGSERIVGELDAAARMIADADDAALILGDQVPRSGRDAVEAAIKLAETGGMRVHGQIMGSEIPFPTDHEQWISFVSPSDEIARDLLDADVVVLVGDSQNPTSTFYYDRVVLEETNYVQLSDDAFRLAKNVPADVGIIGDPGDLMRDLHDALDARISDADRDARLETVAEYRETYGDLAGWSLRDTERGAATDDPRPTKADLARAMSIVAPDAFVFDESITGKFVLLNEHDFQPEQWISNKGGGLGYGLPAAVGAALAERERPDPRDVVGFIGDGSYLYYPQTLYSAARYDVDLTVVIPNNESYHILKDNAVNILGGSHEDYDFETVEFAQSVDFEANVASHGGAVKRVDRTEDLELALTRALSEGGPSVVDVHVQE
jgi:benzoylformate decarboxylase